MRAGDGKQRIKLQWPNHLHADFVEGYTCTVKPLITDSPCNNEYIIEREGVSYYSIVSTTAVVTGHTIEICTELAACTV